jgi:peptidoglycan-associated lipoprotein
MTKLTKTGLLLIVAGLSFGGCHKDKPATTTPKSTDTTKADPGPDTTKKPDPVVKDDQRVSQGLALSADIATACGIKASPDANPNFDYDKDELSPEDRKVLDAIAVCLTTGPLKGKSLALIGRADPRGTDEYNLGLGSRRATTVSQYLVRSGVGQPQLGVTTRGALDATGTDESGWAKDRRVDIQIAAATTEATKG